MGPTKTITLYTGWRNKEQDLNIEAVRFHTFLVLPNDFFTFFRLLAIEQDALIPFILFRQANATGLWFGFPGLLAVLCTFFIRHNY